MLSILRTRALRTTTPLSRTITARINSSAPTRACPSCGAPIPYPASPCPSCAALVPIPPALSLHSLLDVSTPIVNPGGKDTFDIPGELSTLPAHGYDLSPRDLRARMLKRQAALHPDRHNGVDLAADLSGMINKAYETLANPLKRADYILSQYGLDIKEREDATDQDLLMEVLEARETLEEASDKHEIEELKEDNQAKVDGVVEKITAVLSKDPIDFHAAKKLCVELKYWVGLVEAAKERL